MWINKKRFNRLIERIEYLEGQEQRTRQRLQDMESGLKIYPENYLMLSPFASPSISIRSAIYALIRHLGVKFKHTQAHESWEIVKQEVGE